MSRGIDYGLGTANVDRENGIRFGVIPFNALNEWAWEGFEGEYPRSCPHCGQDVVEFDRDSHKRFKKCAAAEYACESCKRQLQNDEVYGDEPSGHTCTDAEYEAHSSDGIDIFITKSPYFTRAAFCSPCAPGACYLTDHCDDGERAYCFNHDWFEGNKAPYPVYSVKTGELVPAPESESAK